MERTKVTSGKVILETGKYVNIILLKAGTYGVSIRALNNTVEISFESGENKNIRFGVPDRASSSTVYSLFADQWMGSNARYNCNISQAGKVVYDNELYYLRFTGDRPKLLNQNIFL